MKHLTIREKMEKSVHESDFSFREKIEKIPKMALTDTFDFHGEKGHPHFASHSSRFTVLGESHFCQLNRGEPIRPSEHTGTD